MRCTLPILSALLALPALAGGPFTLKSRDLAPDRSVPAAQVLKGFGCEGGNRSPQLAWENAPAGTRSFVLTCYDPDAPTGSGWWHWVVANLPADCRELPSGAGSGQAPLPAGAFEGRTDFGRPGYGGPCPPAGDPPHRYIFTIWALKTDRLELDADASPAMVGFLTRMNALDKAELTVRYGR